MARGVGKREDSCGISGLGETPEGESLRRLNARPRKANRFPTTLIHINLKFKPSLVLLDELMVIGRV